MKGKLYSEINNSSSKRIDPPIMKEESNAKTGRQWQIHEKLDFAVYTVISFVSLTTKFGICTFDVIFGTLVEAKIGI